MSSVIKSTLLSQEEEMYVTKRDGNKEIVSFDKILKRIKTIGMEVGIKINYTTLVMKVIDQLYDGISTTKIDELSAEQCASMASIHPDYNILAGRIIVSNHHKNTNGVFSDVMSQLYEYYDKHGKHSPLISRDLYFLINSNSEKYDKLCDYSRDYLIDYFGFKTLERAYLMKINKITVERPQHMWLRVAIGIHGDNYEKIKETYELMSQKYFTHATPTLFNAGTPHPQLSSCYLIAMENDSIEGIYNTLKDCALISKWAGGIGLHIHNVRAAGSHIRGTNGSSNGIVPMLKVFNNTAKYVDQCILPETIIYTTQGPKQIQHCVINETEIFNLKGETEVIQNVLEHHYDGEILEIKTAFVCNNKLTITPQHPVYVLRDNEKQWIDAGELFLTDKIIYSIPTYENDISNITKDDCRIYGYIMKYGLIENGNYTIHIDSNVDIDFIKNYLDTKLVEYKCINNNTLMNGSIIWKPSLQLPFRYSDFYNETNQKRIHNRWLNLSLDKIKVLSCIFEDFKYNCDIECQINYLYLRLCKEALPFGLEYVDNNKEFVCTSIVSIEKNTYNGILYDLQMSKQHDYLLETGLVHNGGGRRNGSFAIYLEPWHADIEMFLQMRKNHGDEELKARDLFYALWVPDLLMERIKIDGDWTLMCPDECPGLSDVYGEEFKTLYTKYENAGKGRKTMKARDLWFQILDAQMETGTPYLLYKDACNKKSNQKNIGTIKSSNLCVAPETKILTDKGHVEIKSLEGQFVNVWNGEEYSNVQIFKTGENQELIDVYTSDGCKITCTKYHKFFIQNSYSKKSISIVEAQNLKKNDKIVKCEYPIIDGKDKMLYPYTHGFFCGDGTYTKNHKEHIRCNFKCIDGHYYCKRHIDFETEHNIETLNNNKTIDTIRCNGISYVKKPLSYLYDEKKKLLEHMEYRSVSENQNRIVIQLPLDIEEKFYVPMNNSIKDKMEWFSGYCDADGCISNNKNNQQLQISSINKDFLMNVKYMLQTCGINPKIRGMRTTGQSYLPDGKGGNKFFDTKPLFRLLITSNELVKLIKLGFNPKRLILNELNLPNRSANQFIKIEKIIDEGRKDDTYCFTEPKKNSGIFNGIITSQCTEILQYSDDKETAVCNLASIALPTFVDTSVAVPYFDYEKLHEITKVVTYNLNRIIDINFYPTPKTETSNLKHRPIGIGVQGLADVFMMMNIPFYSNEAKYINKCIFETIYHGALERSCELAQIQGPYETFENSPASQGELQFDLWGINPNEKETRYDWDELKTKIKQIGLRNSLLVAPMPTASTSQILGFNECIEPITSNIYNRRTLAGEFILANKYLMKDLMKLDMWNEKIKNNIIANHGSIQHIETIPEKIRDKYRTVWEIPMRHLIDMAADRGAFICQSQSLNLWLEDPNYSMLTSMHFYSWNKGLKTGIYYLRRRGRHHAQQFTIEPEKKNNSKQDEHEICEMCSS
jgi:ribonucleoside-diphosphate reductase alpha chain